jgi:hypothetical protein
MYSDMKLTMGLAMTTIIMGMMNGQNYYHYGGLIHQLDEF